MERVWLTAGEICPPFAIALVVEVDGRWEIGALRRAVEAAAAVVPAARVVLRGVGCGLRWEDGGRAPEVREVDGEGWDGRSEVGAGFLEAPLPPASGPFEVCLVRGSPERLVFRVHHAACDARGLLAWAEAVCAVARGERVVVPTGERTDLELAGAARPVPPVADDAVALTGAHTGGTGTVWRRVSLQGSWRGFTYRLVHGLAQHALAQRPVGLVRVQVPVDLRPADGAREVGNFVGMVGVEVAAGVGWEEVRERLRGAIGRGEAAGQVRGVRWLVHVPRWLMRWAGEAGMKRSVRTGRYGASAVVSNVGEVALERLSVVGARAVTAFVVPPVAWGTPCFVIVVRCGERAEVVVGMGAGFAGGGRAERVVEAIVEALGRSAQG